MTTEFEIDDFRAKIHESLFKSGIEELLAQECHTIMQKHRKAMVQELDDLITRFTVMCLTEPYTSIVKIKITTPDA